MELKEELISAISQMEFEEPQVELDANPVGRIGGFIISKSFSGKTQIERQNMLWEKLEKLFDKAKLINIIGLLTMTPEEAEEADG